MTERAPLAEFLASNPPAPSQWVRFHECVPRTKDRKTKVWAVATVTDSELGAVKFFPRWRCYAFFPAPACVFEEECLRDIAAFCEHQTAKWRVARNRARMERLARR